MSKLDDRGSCFCFFCPNEVPEDAFQKKWTHVPQTVTVDGKRRKMYVWRCPDCSREWLTTMLLDKTGKMPGSLAIRRDKHGKVWAYDKETREPDGVHQPQ